MPTQFTATLQATATAPCFMMYQVGPHAVSPFSSAFSTAFGAGGSPFASDFSDSFGTGAAPSQSSQGAQAVATQTSSLSRQTVALRIATAGALSALARRLGVPLPALATALAALAHILGKKGQAASFPAASLTRQTNVLRLAVSAPLATLLHAFSRLCFATGLVVAASSRQVGFHVPASVVGTATTARSLGHVLQAAVGLLSYLTRATAVSRMASAGGAAGLVPRMFRALALQAAGAALALSQRLTLHLSASATAPSAGLARSVAAGRIAFASVASGLSLATARTLTAIPGTVVRLARGTAVLRPGTVLTTTNFSRVLMAVRGASVAVAASLVGITARNQMIAAVGQGTAASARVTGRTVPVATLPLASAQKSRGFTAQASAFAASALARTLLRALQASVNGTSAAMLSTARTLAAIAGSVAFAARGFLENVAASASGVSAVTRQAAKALSGQAGTLVSIARAAVRSFPATAAGSASAGTRKPQAIQVFAVADAALTRSTAPKLPAVATAAATSSRGIAHKILNAFATAIGQMASRALIRALLRQRTLLPIAVRLVALPPEGVDVSDSVADPPAFSAMDPTDGDTLSFDWSRRADVGDTILTANVTSDPPGLVFQGAPVIAGTLVQVNVAGIANLNDVQPVYGVRCAVTFTSGRRSAWTIPLPVRAL